MSSIEVFLEDDEIDLIVGLARSGEVFDFDVLDGLMEKLGVKHYCRILKPHKRGKVPVKVIREAVRKVKAKRMAREAARKVLNAKGSSKAEKTKRGSAFTQRNNYEKVLFT